MKNEFETYQTITGGQSNLGIRVSLNEAPIMALARPIFWPTSHMYPSFSPFNDHTRPDKVFYAGQLDVVLVTSNRQSIVDHWSILVMVVGHVMRDKFTQVGHFSRYHDLVIVDMFLKGVYT